MRPRFFTLQAPLDRLLEIVSALDPIRLAQVLLDFSSLLQSQFWDGRRTGPDFISPMTSLTKRQSGHLAKLVLHHCRSLPGFKLDDKGTLRQVNEVIRHGAFADAAGSGTASPYRQIAAQAVAILDLDDLSTPRLESQYITPANVDLMVLVPILLNFLVILRTREFSPASEFIALCLITALILGPGTLTLIKRTSLHPTESDSGPGCAVLMDDDLTIVILGGQKIVEAITEGGFYLSFADLPSKLPGEDKSIPATERWEEKQVFSDILYGVLEGGCRGACEAMIMRFLHLNSIIPGVKEVAFVVIGGRFISKACRWGLKALAHDSIPPLGGVKPPRLVARLTGELLGLLATGACFASGSSVVKALLYAVAFFVHSCYFGLFARLVLQSQNYRIRTERFLHALGNPPIRKLSFNTRAAAATFVCLLLCRGPRPVKCINVSGVLEILVPDQRDIWMAWKARVADRISYEAEDHITFAPTVPKFPDLRQKRLKDLLDEANVAYDKYRLLPPPGPRRSV